MERIGCVVLLFWMMACAKSTDSSSSSSSVPAKAMLSAVGTYSQVETGDGAEVVTANRSVSTQLLTQVTTDGITQVTTQLFTVTSYVTNTNISYVTNTSDVTNTHFITDTLTKSITNTTTHTLTLTTTITDTNYLCIDGTEQGEDGSCPSGATPCANEKTTGGNICKVIVIDNKSPMIYFGGAYSAGNPNPVLVNQQYSCPEGYTDTQALYTEGTDHVFHLV